MTLDKICDAHIDLMGQAVERMDLTTKFEYANFLAQTYYYVSHSTKFLAFAAGLMTKEDKKYFTRFIKHISEENNHELLALRDLKHLGYDISQFPETSETRMLWESQYYKIQHIDPLSLIGYIISLEMFSAKYLPGFLTKVDEAFGKKATSFVRVHAEEDQDHIDDALAVLNDMTGDRRRIIIDNLLQTSIAYSTMLDSLSNEICFATNDSTSMVKPQEATMML